MSAAAQRSAWLVIKSTTLVLTSSSSHPWGPPSTTGNLVRACHELHTHLLEGQCRSKMPCLRVPLIVTAHARRRRQHRVCRVVGGEHKAVLSPGSVISPMEAVVFF